MSKSPQHTTASDARASAGDGSTTDLASHAVAYVASPPAASEADRLDDAARRASNPDTAAYLSALADKARRGEDAARIERLAIVSRHYHPRPLAEARDDVRRAVRLYGLDDVEAFALETLRRRLAAEALADDERPAEPDSADAASAIPGGDHYPAGARAPEVATEDAAPVSAAAPEAPAVVGGASGAPDRPARPLRAVAPALTRAESYRRHLCAVCTAWARLVCGAHAPAAERERHATALRHEACEAATADLGREPTRSSMDLTRAGDDEALAYALSYAEDAYTGAGGDLDALGEGYRQRRDARMARFGASGAGGFVPSHEMPVAA